MLDSVEVDIPMSDLQMQELAESSAPLAILVGTLIDNIPESLVIGFNAGTGHVSISFFDGGIYLQHPGSYVQFHRHEKKAGTSSKRILGLLGRGDFGSAD